MRGRRKPAVTCALLALLNLPSSAQSDEAFGFLCSEPRGSSYYFENALNPHDPEWTEDGISGGKLLVLIGPENGEGGAEVKFRDASGTFQSASSLGYVHFTGFNESIGTLRVDVYYDSGLNTESYVLHDVETEQPKLVMTTIRSSALLGKVAVFTANCERL